MAVKSILDRTDGSYERPPEGGFQTITAIPDACSKNAPECAKNWEIANKLIDSRQEMSLQPRIS
jgi:hypothetical protein